MAGAFELKVSLGQIINFGVMIAGGVWFYSQQNDLIEGQIDEVQKYLVVSREEIKAEIAKGNVEDARTATKVEEIRRDLDALGAKFDAISRGGG